MRYEEAEDRVTIEGRGLRLTFRREGDRWTHALALGEGYTEIACTVESDVARDDPVRIVSPAYQEVQRHEAVGELCLLLTGQATPHHFSAVVSVREEDAGIIVAWDVADRCRARVDVLAATYLVALGSSDLIDAGPDRVVWGGNEVGQGRLEFAADSPDSVALAEAGRLASRVQALARIVPSTNTQRLRYRWRWTPEVRQDRSGLSTTAGSGAAVVTK